MRTLRTLALLALVGAVALLVEAARRGELRGGLFLVFPMLVGSGLFALGGALLLMLAMGLFAFSAFRAPPEAWAAPAPRADDADAPRERAVRSGGVLLLGPIPIVWGSDRRILPWMVAAGAALLLLALLLFFL